MDCMKPFLTHLTRRIFFLLTVIFWMMNLFFDLSISYSADATKSQKPSGNDEVSIYQIAPDKRGGKAYKLVYLVRAPIDSCWKFKMDFNNDFLVKNKLFGSTSSFRKTALRHYRRQIYEQSRRIFQVADH